VENRTVRIINIDIENFKNVKKGSINLENKRKPYRASILEFMVRTVQEKRHLLMQ
jgi:hypothetical protein